MKSFKQLSNDINEGVRHVFVHPEHGGMITSQPEEWGKKSSAVKSMQTAAKNLGKPIIVRERGTNKVVAHIHPDGWHDLNEEVKDNVNEERSPYAGKKVKFVTRPFPNDQQTIKHEYGIDQGNIVNGYHMIKGDDDIVPRKVHASDILGSIKEGLNESSAPYKVGTKVSVDGRSGEIAYAKQASSPDDVHRYKITDLGANDPYKQTRLEGGKFINHSRVKPVKDHTDTDDGRNYRNAVGNSRWNEETELEEGNALVGKVMKDGQVHYVWKTASGYEVQNRHTGARNHHTGSLDSLDDKGYHWVNEETELNESHMSELHATIGQHMDKHIDTYKKQGGAEALMGHVDGVSRKVARIHGIASGTAKKFVHDYIDSRLTENLEEVADSINESISSSVRLKMLMKDLETEGYEKTHVSLAGKHSGVYYTHPKTKAHKVIRWGKVMDVNESLDESVDPDKAREILNDLHGDSEHDFFTLSSSQKEELLHHAKEAKYKKPANANGSRARYFHAHLTRIATRTPGLGGLAKRPAK